MRRVFVALALIAACSPFEASTDSAPTPADAGTTPAANDAGTSDAGTTTTAPPADGGSDASEIPVAFCATKTDLLCDDFESPTKLGWSTLWQPPPTDAALVVEVVPAPASINRGGNVLHARATTRSNRMVFAYLRYTFAVDPLLPLVNKSATLSFEVYPVQAMSSYASIGSFIHHGPGGSSPFDELGAALYPAGAVDLPPVFARTTRQGDAETAGGGPSWHQIVVTVVPDGGGGVERKLAVDGHGLTDDTLPANGADTLDAWVGVFDDAFDGTTEVYIDNVEVTVQ